jgi:hypothetical protein
MKHIGVLLIGLLNFAVLADAMDLSTASSKDLLAVYKQLRTIQGSGEGAITENVIFKRDAATFTFISGRITFASPVAGRVLAAQFQGEGKFELEPPSPLDQYQISRFAKSPKLTDTFREAVFFFTDDSYSELGKLVRIKPAPGAIASASFAKAQKQYAEDYNNWVENQSKRNPAMRNLAARILADLTDNSSKGFFLADFAGKKSGDLLFHISWNRSSLLLPEYNKGEEVMLLHIRNGSSYEWWSGFHLSSEYEKSKHPDHNINPAHCINEQVDLQIKDNLLAATVQMELEVNGDPVRILPFNLDNVLRIASIEDVAGNQLGFIQEDRKLDSDPWLILAEPAKPKEKYKIKITYKEDSTPDSRVVHQRGSGLYYVTARESWFPSFGAFDDRTQFELRARSPKKFKFVASGSMVMSEKTKDELVSSWKSEIPLGVIGFNYGDFVEASQTTPELAVTAYSGKEVPDELKNLENAIFKAQLAQAHNRTMRDVESASGIMSGGFNTAINVKYAAGMSFQAFKFFEYCFGKLPFKAVSVTEQPIRGYGQSWPNLIFLPYDSLLDATTRHSLRLQDKAEQREFYRIVAVHEMAHQWWGHLVGWKTYHDQWLSEGVAEFASALYLRQFEPKEWNTFWNLRRNYLLSKTPAGYRPVDAGPMWLNPQLDEHNGTDNSRLIYDKGAYVMEMLRAIMFDPQQKNPDGRFLAMMHDFTSTYAGQNASTEDFRAIVEKHMGRSMEWFFDQWVYGRDIPTYNFSYQLSDADAGHTELAMSITQSGVPESFQMSLPVYASFNGEMRYLALIGVGGSKPTKVTVKLPLCPDKIFLDPNHSILAEIHQ